MGWYFGTLQVLAENERTQAIRQKISALLRKPAMMIGGGYRDRTDDLLNAIQALYQTELIPQTSDGRSN